MSTNYYALVDQCDRCGLAKKLHIGQWAAGRFLMARHREADNHPALMTWDDWTSWLSETCTPIRNEYGRFVSLDELKDIAISTRRSASEDRYCEWQGPTYVAPVGREFS